MNRAELVVVGIAQLATPRGDSPRVGKRLEQIHVLDHAAVACSGGRILWVGPERELTQAVVLDENTRRLDARGGTVLPGFVDAHTHLPFAGWRESEFDERLRGATYSDIAARGGGILSTVDRTRKADRAELTASVSHRLDEMLALGTTTVEAKSGYGLALEQEIKQLEALRAAATDHAVQLVPTFLGAHTVPREHRENRSYYIDLLLNEMLPLVVEQGLAEYADAFVDEHAFSIEEARRILGHARDAGLGVRLHADQLADDGGAELAAELGAASADHLEHVSDVGIKAMARAGTAAVLLPAATFFLRSSVLPPGRRLVDAGVPVVVATDFNPGTCPCESMGAALWFACLQAGLTVDEAITASTLNAAFALGRGDEVGSIEPGKRADLVVHAIPNRYHLVYRFGVPRVRAVVAGGQIAHETIAHDR